MLQLAAKTPTAPVSPGRPPRQPKEKEPFVADGAQDETPASIGQSRRILVVDDNPVVLKAFELKLKALGFEVTTISNGAAVASTAERVKAELIILDINFPPAGALEWTGFTIIQWLRRFPELATIPVILITGGDSSQYKEKSLAAGAVGFFQKPMNYKELVALILQTLGNSPQPNGTPLDQGAASAR